VYAIRLITNSYHCKYYRSMEEQPQSGIGKDLQGSNELSEGKVSQFVAQAAE
jgi:hypothetical protein